MGTTKNNFVRESWSQCGEDLVIDFLFQQLNIEKPSYIDIGAHHPSFINNTFLFYRKGARGINIEPDSALLEEFKLKRKEDINLGIGIGEEEATTDFFIMNEPTLNTFLREEAERMVNENSNAEIREIKKIRIRTLQAVINEYNGGKFPDLLSIDVEGLDEVILRSVNFEKDPPKVMCVETLTFSSIGKGKKKTELIEFIKGKGYMVYADTYINTIFVREQLYLK
jgi:FkbM family methyltransferase